MTIAAAIVIAGLIGQVGYAKRDGSIPSSACSNMLPGHSDFTEQNSDSPYSIYPSSVFYLANVGLRVYISKSSSTVDPAKGFYCQARNGNSPTKVEGSFENIKETERGHNCFLQSNTSGKFDTISHSSSWSGNPKGSLALTWKPPVSTTANVTFRCTFVQTFFNFWVGVESVVVGPLDQVSVGECCDMEEVVDDCMPLCHRADQEPEDSEFVVDVLNNASKNEESKCFFDNAQIALRCKFWSRTAEDFDHDALQECCNEMDVSPEYRDFCSREIYGTMDYSADRFNNCLTENPGLASCIIYPREADEESTTAFFAFSPTKTDYFSPPEATTSITKGMATTSEINLSSATATSTTVATTAGTTTGTEIQPIFVETSGAGITYQNSPGTSFVSETNTTSVKATSSKITNPTSAVAEIQSTPSETTSAEITYSTSTVASTTPKIKSTPSEVPYTTTESSTPSPGPTSFPVQDKTVVYTVNTTVNVVGAIQNDSLRVAVFNDLRTDLLIPALAKLRGYIQVTVGVQYFEGSLVVISEGEFLQQSDGYIPLVLQVRNVVTARLDELNNEIGKGDEKWTVARPVQVTRKATNGFCQNVDCGSGKICAEVGSNSTVCICLNSDNVEIICADDDTGLSAGAIVGIVIGCLVLLAIIIGIFVMIRRHACPWQQKDEIEKSVYHTPSATTAEYIYPDSQREDPVYNYIPNDLPPPPPVPPDNRTGRLPSHSAAYEEATADRDREGKSLKTQQGSDGYMETVLSEQDADDEKDEFSPANVYAETYSAGEQGNRKKAIGADLNTVNYDTAEPSKAENNSSDYIALDGYEFAVSTDQDDAPKV